MKTKTDLLMSIFAAVLGVVIAFFVTNLFIGPVKDFSYKTIESTVDADLTDPDPEIFNYQALNPTVEVYVGECKEFSQYGECVETETYLEESSTEGTINQESQ